MVIFQERYPHGQELSDRMSENDFAHGVIKQIKRFHKHSDGSEPHLIVTKGPHPEELLRKEDVPIRIFKDDTASHQKMEVRTPEIAVVHQKKEPVFLTCNCGQSLKAESDSDNLNVTYLDVNPVPTYGGQASNNVAYGKKGGAVSYGPGSSSTVTYGGK